MMATGWGRTANHLDHQRGATPAMVSAELEALQKDFTRRAHVAILQEEKARPGTLIGDDISALEKILQRR